MTLKFNLLKEDYINYNLYFNKTSEQRRRSFIVNKYAFPVILLIIFVILSSFVLDSLLTNLIIWFIISVLWLMFWPKYYMKKISESITQEINQGNTESLLGDKIVTLGEKTIDYSSENKVCSSNASYKYSSIERIGIDYDCIFIFVSSISAIIIPFSAFQSSEQKDEFLNIISEKSGIKFKEPGSKKKI